MKMSRFNTVPLCLLGFSLFVLTTLACKKDAATTDPFKCATCSGQPQAAAANDASSKGIYKGVMIGSTGTIKFDINNTATSITAVMVIDGTTVNLTSAVLWQAGVAYVAPFTGTLNGQALSINFSVGISGGTPTITSSSIPGHPTAQFALVKETSAALLEAFEGSYSSTLPETGTFNMLVIRSLNKFSGVSRKTNGTSNGGFDGTIDAGGKMTTNGLVIGTLKGDAVDGSFKDSNGSTITITAKRTL